MSESEALVTHIEGEFAVVEVAALPSACGKCGDKGQCGKGQSRPRRFVVPNTTGAQVGDQVTVCVADGAILKAAALSYLMPLLFVIAAAAAATAWFGDGLPAVAGAAAGLLLGLAVLRAANTRFACRREPWPTVRLQRRTSTIDKEA